MVNLSSCVRILSMELIGYGKMLAILEEFGSSSEMESYCIAQFHCANTK